jgi:hypothetical protein
MPMLFALAAGGAGAAGAQAMAMVPMSMGTAMTPGWVTALGMWSWPLLFVSVALLVWSFWRASPVSRGLAYIAVALLIVNRLDMTPWLFFPAMALLAGALALSWARRSAPATGLR